MIDNKKLDATLLTLGLRDILIGTEYVRRAVRSYRPGMSMTKVLYPAVAAAAGSTPSRVERAMRHAIETGFDRSGYSDEVLAIFGNTIDPNKGKPTVSEFVAALARHCREAVA